MEVKKFCGTAAVENHRHRLVFRGHVVGKEIGHGQARAVRPLTKGDGIMTQLTEFRDVRKQAELVLVPVRFISIHMTVIGIGTSVLSVFIAIVQQRCTRCGQQPSVSLKGSMVGRNIPWLPGQSIFRPLVVRIVRARIGTTGEPRNIVTAHVGHHQGARSVLVLAPIRPIIQMLVILISGNEDVVHHCMVEDEVRLTVETFRSHVGVDGPVLCLVVLQRMAGPTHRRLAFEVNIGTDGFEPFIDLGDQVRYRQVLNVLDRIDPCSVEVERLHPPEGVCNELLGCIPIFPIHVRHVGGELAIKTMFGPIATNLTTNAAGVEPIGMGVVILVVFVDVIHHEIHHHPNSGGMCSLNHGLEVFWRTQSGVNTSGLNRPIPVKRRHVMDSICGLSRPVRCRIKRRQPKGVDAKVSKIIRLDH